ncbi:helix-turn-helix domain-containing protein [Arhodomonas sp. AD133]|uniref:helix-turn-helix domain-containing protein n=1 Tax=Arhodomonas sp. AD133 TaxID=3415009 RepID=UPI003EBA03D4
MERPTTGAHQLVMFCAGEECGTYSYENRPWEPYRKRRHEWFIAPAYENHIRWRLDAQTAQREPATICRIHLCPATLEEAAQEYAGRRTPAFSLPHRMGVNDTLMTSLAYELRKELLEHTPTSVSYGSMAASMLAAHLLRRYCSLPRELPDDRGKLKADAKQRVQDYVEAQLAEPITLADMAEVACMSKYHFARVFKNTFEQTPHQFLVACRLSKARQLLKTSDLAISRVAETTGFGTTGTMSRAFRSHLGLLPSTYRKRHRVTR